VWEGAGRRLAGSCDAICAAAILGDDPVATAASALGIARAQSLRRRVVVIDLLGENSDLSALVEDHEAPGITDVLEYGVSLRRAAHPVAGTPNLFVMPPGVESPLHQVFLTHPRWNVLIEDFRDAGALLLLVAPALVPGAESLIDRLDGVLVVRGAALPPVRVPLIADVRLTAQYPPALRRTPALARARIDVEPRKSRGALLALGAAALLAASAGVWYLRPSSSETAARKGATPPAAADSARVAAAAASAIPVAPPPGAGWGVELSRVNSAVGAMLRVAQVVDSFPAPTYSPTLPAPGGARWFRFMVGAFSDSMSADSFLVRLRSQGSAAVGAGRVVRTPLALLVADSIAEPEALHRVADLRSRGLPAYALRTAIGVSRVYVGAFEEEQTAQLLAASLDSLKLRATLVPRVGSVF
jgi:hypothetical protein